MQIDVPDPPHARDRRVRRSRAMLMGAAVALVKQRGTANVAITEIAEAADVSRQVLYQHFGDRDTLLLEAALDLAQRELLPEFNTDECPVGVDRARMLVAAKHFAKHHVFYRAILTSSSSYALTARLSNLLLPMNRKALAQSLGRQLDDQAIDDIAMFVTSGLAATVNTWVVDGEDPLDSEELTERLMRIISSLVRGASMG